jgi:hypothetical protein
MKEGNHLILKQGEAERVELPALLAHVENSSNVQPIDEFWQKVSGAFQNEGASGWLSIQVTGTMWVAPLYGTSHETLGQAELLKQASDAMKRLIARNDEDLKKWAEKLASDTSEATD